MEKKLAVNLENLKKKLFLAFYEKQSLTDPDVVKLSQEMDVIITQLQRMYV